MTAAQLQQRIDTLVARVRAAQQRDGSLMERGRSQWAVGQTSLGVLALRAAGVPPDDPTVRSAVDFLGTHNVSDRGVYQTSLRLMAIQSVDAAAHRQLMIDDATNLVSWQDESGGWGYPRPERPDSSNTQFALLGLNAAETAGLRVPDTVWQAARRYFATRQANDGGWGYLAPSSPTGSMTAAGVTGMYVCDLWLHVSTGRCGVYPDERPIAAGLQWLAKHFSVTRNPGTTEWKFYYLYALERTGVILAQRYFGGFDWYREGVQHLVGDSEDLVTAGAGNNEWAYLRNCYMLLFLAKGNAPILLHKAQWTGAWNTNRFDARFLIEYISRQLDQPFDWQIIPLSAPLDQLMAAPILYVSGSGQPFWTAEELRRLKQYVDAGGFVLVEAALGDRTFDAAFRKALKTAFPDDKLEPLPTDHPIYSAYFDIPAAQRPRLEAIKGPCWISVIYAPQGLSCTWDVAKYDSVDFKMGMNIVAYVTGLRKLEGKLTAPSFTLPPEAAAERRRGAFTMGQLVHGADWRPHKVAWSKVLDEASRKAGLDVYSRPLPIKLGTDSPFEAQMLYLTGTGEVTLSEKDRQELRTYVERGGFIFAEAACGSARFDRSFRELARQLWPDHPLEEMPLGHPLYELGEPLGDVVYSKAVLDKDPGLKTPQLEDIEVDGRTVLVYSKYDISSAIDGHPCYQCPSVLEPSASRLALKIVLYGLSS